MRRFAAIALTSLAVVALLWNAPGMAIGGIHLYQRTLSPWAARAGVRCRFVPTCSHYAEVVIARDGIVSGGWKTIKRIARCGPWTRLGTIDNP